MSWLLQILKLKYKAALISKENGTVIITDRSEVFDHIIQLLCFAGQHGIDRRVYPLLN